MANTKSKANNELDENILNEPAISEDEAVTEVPVKSEQKRQYKVKQNLTPNTIVTVVNGAQGKLVYKSRRSGERFEWEDFGDEQDMELQELKNAKSASKKFFENNWFLIDDPEILEYLGVSHYYKYALNFHTFDALFEKDVLDIKSSIAKLSAGQKKSVAYRAKQLITDGTIDSMKVINALEESLSIELIDR